MFDDQEKCSQEGNIRNNVFESIRRIGSVERLGSIHHDCRDYCKVCSACGLCGLLFPMSFVSIINLIAEE